MTGTLERWRARVEEGLPFREDILARNRAITATYARWYLDHPELCKWSGMAVTGSYDAGVHLERLAGGGRVARWAPGGLRAAQVALLARANNDVFDDIGWAHAAYLAPEGGLAAVEEALRPLPTHADLLEGFRKIEQGRLLLAADPAAGRERIWEGNRDLLRHEQLLVVQPLFESFHLLFKLLLSASARTDFRLGEPRVRQGASRAFAAYTLRQGRRWPDVTRFEQRWSWIDAEALPCWRALDASASAPLRERMEALARLAPGPHRTA